MTTNMKRMMAAALCVSMIGSMAMAVNAEEATGGYQVNEELAAGEGTTLTYFGPGVFGTAGEEGTVDLITGAEMPGYNVIIDRWNELYPNCELVINTCGWDSWQANIQTACMDGEVDIIGHGATMVDLTEDLAPYIEAEPEYRASIYATSDRMSNQDHTAYKVSGIPVTVSPAGVWLDTEKFENFGVELPTADWTYDDMLAIAEKLTGTDPVTGEASYGIQYYAAGENNLWFNHVWLASSIGADIFTYNTTPKDAVVDYTNEKSVKAFQMIKDLAQYASPEVREGVGVTKVFDGTNTWAMLMNEGLSANWKDMGAAGTQGRYYLLPLPKCTEGRYEGLPIPHAGDNNMAIYKDSPDKAWAWEFIQFMTTDEVALQWIADVGQHPNNIEAKKYVEGQFNENVLESITTALEAVPENFNNATNYNFNNVSFGPTTNNLITAVDNVINGYMTPEEAAQFMQDGVDEFLATLE